MIGVDDVRELVDGLPRAYEVLVRGRIKFRVGAIVFAAFSRDESLMGFGFPRDERDALIAGDPAKFLLPPTSDLRFQWVMARTTELDVDEMRELVLDAWAMVVPKKVSAPILAAWISPP